MAGFEQERLVPRLTLASNLSANYDQVIIYGAKGWLGRSAIELLMEENYEFFINRTVLIGSKTETADKARLPIDIYTAEDSTGFIKQNTLFLNAAFLRREKLNQLGPELYDATNKKITKFGLDLLENGRIRTFINLSSGVASYSDKTEKHHAIDLYAILKKKYELLFADICSSTNTQFLNCRIYSLSGRHINEISNLAFPSLIIQALYEPKKVFVKSPTTMRTYVDAKDLIRVLFELALKGKDINLDSGGDLVSLGALAKAICEIQDNSFLDLPEVFEKSPDYYGDYKRFNSIATDLGLKLKSINEQIIESLKAFTN